MRRWLALLCVWAGVGLAANPKATSLAKDAERLYGNGQYKDAAKLLDEAIKIEPIPKFTYNLARCYDQAGELQAALDAYRRYVSLPTTDTEPELVKRSNLSMDRLRGLLAKQEADGRIRDAEKERLEREAREAQQRAEAEAERARRQKAQFDAKEKEKVEVQQTKANGRKIAAFVVGGVGLASLGVGIAFGLLSNGSKQAFRIAAVVEDKRARQADTVSQALIADVTLAVGLAAAITALILYPKGDPQAEVSFLPLPSGGLGLVTLSF